MSSPPPASPPMVWPPSNPSGTVIPFPLPWGQTGCCPPGGMDALMKCYCDIQQASAFIGQIMLDQINNNPAIIAAIIAGIEKSGSSLPTLGVTNGQPAQPGQVGEFVTFVQNFAIPTAVQTITLTMGVLQPGDWDVWGFADTNVAVTDLQWEVSPIPAGFSPTQLGSITAPTAGLTLVSLWAGPVEALISVPTLIPVQVVTNYIGSGPSAGNGTMTIIARRAR